MFKTLKDGMPRDKDLPERCFELEAFHKVLHGEQYDHIAIPFHMERTSGGEYIEVVKRRPSVRYNLCQTVVNDSVSILFSEAHFPKFMCADQATREAIDAHVKEAFLNQKMTEAAFEGSVGSIAIKFAVLNNRAFYEPVPTNYLTPTFDPLCPDELLYVREQFKIRGEELEDLGYEIDEEDERAMFWFTRDFTREEEIHYLPVKFEHGVKAKKIPLVVDKDRTIFHGFGFVPMRWIKNLPGGKGVDGRCTFKEAINTQIAIEQQLSNSDRALRYSSDPTMIIKDAGGMDRESAIVKGSGNALVLDSESDARMLEINGKASAAVIDYVKFCRELALEAISGNRANAERMGAATSGRSMELMNQALIWLADKLRISYGEGGLLKLMEMFVKASHIYPLEVAGKPIGKLSLDDPLSLKWPAWYQPTAQDALSIASSLTMMTGGTVMSRETAVESLASDYDIEDVAGELAKIEADDQERMDKAMATAEHAASLAPKADPGGKPDNRTKGK